MHQGKNHCQFKVFPLSEEMRGEMVALKVSIALRGHQLKFFTTASPSKRSSRVHTQTTTGEPSWIPNSSAGKHCIMLTLPSLLSQITTAASVGVGPVKSRVVAVTAAATGVPNCGSLSSQQQGTKACGEGPQGQHRHIRKTSLRKAVNTARRTGVAQYRGRTIRAEPKAPVAMTANHQKHPRQGGPPKGKVGLKL